MPLPVFRRRSYLPLLLEWVVRLILAPLYRVKAIGTAHVPRRGGVLLIANHLSYVDIIALQIACPRPIRFIGYKGLRRSAFLNWCFEISGTLSISDTNPLEGVRTAVKALQAGELVLIFPEGHISRTGQLMALKPGFEMIARLAKVPVVPVAHDGLWGSVFSFAGKRYIWKSPRLMPTPVAVVFGAPQQPEAATRDWARVALLDLWAEAFEQRPVLQRHIGRECARTLTKHPRRVAVIDRTLDRREITCAQLFAAAALLSRRIRQTIPERRVGVVLPPGIGACIANLAVLFAGKVPVNLNFTLGRAALETSFRIGGISTVISAGAVRAKVPGFPWPERTLDLKDEIAAAGGKAGMAPWLIAAMVLPNQWCAALLGMPKRGDREEAGLLFTSGSSGEPKGVVLTHRNIIANCDQIASLSILPENCVILGCLPIFHSFGFTATLWYPLLRGCGLVTVPSPLDTRRVIDAIHEEGATVLFGAPTFLRPLLKKATRRELRSLDLVITGAEKLPDDLYEAFLKQFHVELLQGYGLTETTPAASLNQPHPEVVFSTNEPQVGKRRSTVGRILPGMTARIMDPDTGATLPHSATGIVLFRGANVFGGYLNDPDKTAAAFRDGWFVTGDLGRFDDEGFLVIEGRLSRFSKIGGEMVPHGTVEQTILKVYGLEHQETPAVFVAGVPDAAKGEALVLLATQEIAADDLRQRLAEAGLPNLWVPKIIRRVEQIPLLGTGKLDLKRCRELVRELAG